MEKAEDRRMQTAWHNRLNIHCLERHTDVTKWFKCFKMPNKFKIIDSGDSGRVLGSRQLYQGGIGGDFKLSVIFCILNWVVDTGAFVL